MGFIDLTGQRFGKLTVLQKGQLYKTSGGAYITMWDCKCDCGNLTTVAGQKLRNGKTTSCGCGRHDNKGPRYEDITGQRFGRLTVIRFIPQSERTTRGYDWWCRCDCGKEIKASANKLKRGLQQSCGCLKEEYKARIGDVNRKYKYTNKRLYGVYKAMVGRCTDPENKRWPGYGGRGIGVCDEWLGEFGYDAFAEWAMSTGFDPEAKQGVCTLDRINVDRGYSPKNCRWITNLEQQNNRTTNIYLTYNGKSQSIADWSRELKIPYSTLRLGIRNGKTLDYFFNDYVPRGTKS